VSKTVVLLNPMGADVTPFVDGSLPGAQLLRGTILQPGDTLYTVPYVNNAGAANIAAGSTMVDNKVNSTAGDILLVGYSEGCQVINKWMRDHGASSPVTPTSRLKCLLIADSARKFGGFIYGHTIFAGLGDVGGMGSTVPYSVVSLARQYDGWSDFPTGDADVQAALDDLSILGSDDDAIANAMRSIAAAFNNTDTFNAAENAVVGMSAIHTMYLNVTPDDPVNVTYTDPAQPNIKWVWSPTYPVPLLGSGNTFPQADQALRQSIESKYDRPVTLPDPDYSGVNPWLINPSPFPIPSVPQTGWWAVIVVVVNPAGAGLSIVGGSPRVSVGNVVRPAAAPMTVIGGMPNVVATQNKIVTPTGVVLTLIGSHPAIGETIVPNGRVLTITGGQPGILLSDNKVAAPSSPTLGIFGGAPTVVLPQTLIPDTAALSIVGSAPTVSLSDNRQVTPAGAVLAAAGDAPLIFTPITVTPAAALLAISGAAPTAALSDNLTVAPAGAALQMQSGTPAIVTPQTFTPAGAVIALAGGTPSLSVSNGFVPNPAFLSIVGGVPIVSTPILVTPGGAVLSIVGSHPSLDGTIRPSGAVVAVTGGQPVVTVADNKTVTPTGAPLSIVGGVPIVALPVVATPSAAAIAVAGGAPVVALSDNKIVTPAAAPLAVAGGQPVVATPRLVVPAGPALTVTGGQPVVAVSSNQLVTPLGATLAIAGGTPVVVRPQTVTPAGAVLAITGGSR
jgi:hypothetical protein